MTSAPRGIFPLGAFLANARARFCPRISQSRQASHGTSSYELGLRSTPSMMLLGDADMPARWYYRLKAAYLVARQRGGELDHPLGASDAAVAQLSGIITSPFAPWLPLAQVPVIGVDKI